MSINLQSLKYSRGKLSVLDQLKLPLDIEYIDIANVQDAWSVIRKMQVRGAPLIAIVGALGLAVDINENKSKFLTTEETLKFIVDSIDYLRTSRPTAVNLFIAAENLTNKVNELFTQPAASISSISDGVILAAEKMLEDDLATNIAMGTHGANKILEIVDKEKIRVLTICNTGSLATSGYGTALGVVRSLHNLNKLEHVYACETRPYNQGARLTAFEIVQDNLPGTLITDSMASALMAVKGVDCVIVGADRVAANGDVANKIGTYQLAIAAKYHGIPFFAAVPSTTFDLSLSSGSLIHIEERPAEELTMIFGQKLAPDGIGVWNPCFDVTPCSLVRGIITELGVAETGESSTDGLIDIPAFLRAHGFQGENIEKAVVPIAVPSSFQRMTEPDIALFVANNSKLRGLVGCESGQIGSQQLSVAEVGDGNLNFVYIVNGPTGTIVIKQALPYVRCVGENWPLSIDRITFECNALKAQRQLIPTLVPEVYYFNRAKALLAMEYIPPPHIILRKAFIQGLKFSTFAKDIGDFLARTLFGSSALALGGAVFRTKISEWSLNTSLCALTEQVVFSDPYLTTASAPFNRHTTPQLDDYVSSIQKDTALKIEVSALKSSFLSKPQALLHGDLHTGSIMACEGSTYVIDPEFAFYGPMGFDIGAVLANMFLAYFSQPGHHGPVFGDWLLDQTVLLWNTFQSEFQVLWREAAIQGKGEIYVQGILNLEEDLALAQEKYFIELLLESLRFAGAKMIRRIVGIAHVADLEEISDQDLRAVCEKRSLLFARRLIVLPVVATTITKVVEIAKEINDLEIPLLWPM